MASEFEANAKYQLKTAYELIDDYKAKGRPEHKERYERFLALAQANALLALLLEVRSLKETILEATDPRRAEKEREKAERADERRKQNVDHAQRLKELWEITKSGDIYQTFERTSPQIGLPVRVYNAFKRDFYHHGEELAGMTLDQFTEELHKEGGGMIGEWRNVGIVAIHELRKVYPLLEVMSPGGTPGLYQ